MSPQDRLNIPLINYPAVTLSLMLWGVDIVEKLDRSKAAKAGDILYRYMWARHRCTGAPAPADAAWLAFQIVWGKRKFDNIHVEPDENPPILWDNQRPAFFSSMIRIDGGPVPRPADLAAWRTYVLYKSVPPELPIEAPEPAHITSQNTSSKHDVIAEVWGKQTQLDGATPRRRWRLHFRIPRPVHPLKTQRA